MEATKIGDRYDVICTLQVWTEQQEEALAEHVERGEPERAERADTQARTFSRAARLYSNGRLQPPQALEAGVQALADAKKARSARTRARYEGEAAAWALVYRLTSMAQEAEKKPVSKFPLVEVTCIHQGELIDFYRFNNLIGEHTGHGYRPTQSSRARFYRVINDLAAAKAGIIQVELSGSWMYEPDGVIQTVPVQP